MAWAAKRGSTIAEHNFVDHGGVEDRARFRLVDFFYEIERRKLLSFPPVLPGCILSNGYTSRDPLRRQWSDSAGSVSSQGC